LGRFLGSSVQDSDDDLAVHESVDALWTEICGMSSDIETAAALSPHTRGAADPPTLRSLYGYPPQLRQIMTTLEQIRDQFGATRVCFDALLKSRDVIASVIESRKVYITSPPSSHCDSCVTASLGHLISCC
jgi:hypothetical protein